MPNIAALLRAEISRVARKEAKSLAEPLRKQVTTLRRDNAAHKQTRAKLERRVLELERIVRTSRIAVAQPVDEDAKLRFSPARLKSQRERLGLSARAYDKVRRTARTIADVEASDEVLPEHIAEAVQYRLLDRKI